MKAATGELNLTVITIIAIAAVVGFFSVVLFPTVKNSIMSQWSGVNNTKVDTSYQQ